MITLLIFTMFINDIRIYNFKYYNIKIITLNFHNKKNVQSHFQGI